MDLKEKMGVSSLSDSIANLANSFKSFVSNFKSVENTINNDIVSKLIHVLHKDGNLCLHVEMLKVVLRLKIGRSYL